MLCTQRECNMYFSVAPRVPLPPPDCRTDCTFACALDALPNPVFCTSAPVRLRVSAVIHTHLICFDYEKHFSSLSSYTPANVFVEKLPTPTITACVTIQHNQQKKQFSPPPHTELNQFLQSSEQSPHAENTHTHTPTHLQQAL